MTSFLFENKIHYLGLLFWSDWGSNPHIGRSALDGSNAKIVDLGSGPRWPNSIALDVVNQTLFYIDAMKDQLLSMDYNGNQHQVITGHSTVHINHPFTLDILPRQGPL